MALIEEYHVVADMYEVDPETNPDIIEGDVVTLNSAGNAVLASNTGVAVGLAGDSSETSSGHTPFAADLVIGAHSKGVFGAGGLPVAKTQSTSNRVSDFFNETKASGKITVYNGGGKFNTDRFETEDGGSPVTYSVGDLVYSSANGLLINDSNGGAAPLVGKVVRVPFDYPSGVPGTDTTDGSLSLGSFLTLVLSL